MEMVEIYRSNLLETVDHHHQWNSNGAKNLERNVVNQLHNHHLGTSQTAMPLRRGTDVDHVKFQALPLDLNLCETFSTNLI